MDYFDLAGHDLMLVSFSNLFFLGALSASSAVCVFTQGYDAEKRTLCENREQSSLQLKAAVCFKHIVVSV